ncbi:hypothetical protein [Alicyclobacillus acidiphilus]|uniref:hypothetical protein n=1 Tax=Alicyclobacillus acidiphilus TaxID=182455 RepID=UPI00157B0379|nr:hypothetical protein [Alicyclobacillus acidiphilus]
MKYWIIFLGVIVLLIVVYTILFLYARRRQRAFDEQYLANKERHEVFVLNKKRVREKGNSGISKYVPFRTYQVTGRITVGQTMRGVNMNRVTNVTFRTTKEEYDKIEVNHKYKMDIMGNYIGNVVTEVGSKRAKSAKRAQPKRAVGEASKGSRFGRLFGRNRNS